MENLPKEQWAQVLEETGKRKFISLRDPSALTIKLTQLPSQPSSTKRFQSESQVQMKFLSTSNIPVFVTQIYTP